MCFPNFSSQQASLPPQLATPRCHLHHSHPITLIPVRSRSVRGCWRRGAERAEFAGQRAENAHVGGVFATVQQWADSISRRCASLKFTLVCVSRRPQLPRCGGVLQRPRECLLQPLVSTTRSERASVRVLIWCRKRPNGVKTDLRGGHFQIAVNSPRRAAWVKTATNMAGTNSRSAGCPPPLFVTSHRKQPRQYPASDAPRYPPPPP